MSGRCLFLSVRVRVPGAVVVPAMVIPVAAAAGAVERQPVAAEAVAEQEARPAEYLTLPRCGLDVCRYRPGGEPCAPAHSIVLRTVRPEVGTKRPPTLSKRGSCGTDRHNHRRSYGPYARDRRFRNPKIHKAGALRLGYRKRGGAHGRGMDKIAADPESPITFFALCRGRATPVSHILPKYRLCATSSGAPRDKSLLCRSALHFRKHRPRNFPRARSGASRRQSRAAWRRPLPPMQRRPAVRVR